MSNGIFRTAIESRKYGVLVDMSPIINFKGMQCAFHDLAIKIVSDDGALLYTSSTDKNYRTTLLGNPKFDSNARAYFRCTDIAGISAHKWIPFISEVFDSIREQASALSSNKYAEISDVLFLPNCDGNLLDSTPILNLFRTNNKNTISFLRMSANSIETSDMNIQKWHASFASPFNEEISSPISCESTTPTILKNKVFAKGTFCFLKFDANLRGTILRLSANGADKIIFLKRSQWTLDKVDELEFCESGFNYALIFFKQSASVQFLSEAGASINNLKTLTW